jgi:hypothetical protein
MFTETAVNTHGENVTFFLEPTESQSHHEWGASLAPWHPSMTAVVVGSIHLSHFIRYAATRRAGRTEGSQVVAKMDVEGAEYTLVPHLLATGTLCLINQIFVEFHTFSTVGGLPPTSREAFVADVQYLLRNSGVCNGTVMGRMDDESYGNTWMPLPGDIPWHQ